MTDASPWRDRANTVIVSLGALALFAVAWRVLVALSDPPLPTLGAIGGGLRDLIDEGVYFTDVRNSLIRFTLGWFAAAALGIPIGLLTGRDRKLLGPLVELNLHAQRAIPVLALVPLTFYLWGLSEISKVFLVTWGGFFPIWVSTHVGARAVNPNYLNAARSLGIDGFAMWRRVLVPHVSGSIISGLRVAIGVCLICVVAGELTGTFEQGFFAGGLGYRIQREATIYRVDRLLACIITFGALGWILDRLFIRTVRPVVTRVAGFDPNRSVLRVGSAADR